MTRTRKYLDPTRTGQDAEQLHADLNKRIVGQPEAIEKIVSVYQMYLAGMASPCRPIGSFLFLGPTGTGKTRIVEATAESLVGDARAVIKIDCAELQHSHEIAKLVGSPPGYLGHRETHALLSQENLNQFHTEKIKISFVLFDEIEKASDALWNLLLGILDKAALTLGNNCRADFSRTIIFLTSNLGAGEMKNILRPGIGFGAGEAEQSSATPDAKTTDKLSRAAIEAARRNFLPEFMNRIDKVVVFKPLGSAELRKVLDLELGILQQRISNSSTTTPFIFSLTPGAKKFLLEEGTHPEYGARHLKRAIDRELTYPLSNLVASHQISSGDLIGVAFNSSEQRLSFDKDLKHAFAAAAPQAAEMADTLPTIPPAHALQLDTSTAAGFLPSRAAQKRSQGHSAQ